MRILRIAIEGLLVAICAWLLKERLEDRGVQGLPLNLYVNGFVIVIGGCLIWIDRHERRRQRKDDEAAA